MNFLDRIVEILTKLLYNFLAVVPNVLGALLIFLVGWFIAKVFAYIVKRLLRSLQIDALAEQLNDIDFISRSRYNVVPSTVFSKLLYYVVLLVFAVVATEILNISPVTQLVSDIITYIPNVFAAIIVLFLGLLLSNFIKNIVQTAMQSMGIPSFKILGNIVFYFIFLMTLVTAIKQLGVEADFIETNLSYIVGGSVLAFAIGYGLASKEMMANFLASFYSKGKFKVGDVISINGFQGTIIEMSGTSLTLQSGDNRKMIIPLHKLTSENVELFDT